MILVSKFKFAGNEIIIATAWAMKTRTGWDIGQQYKFRCSTQDSKQEQYALTNRQPPVHNSFSNFIPSLYIIYEEVTQDIIKAFAKTYVHSTDLPFCIISICKAAELY